MTSKTPTMALSWALATNAWHITARDALLGYAWAWLENQVAAAVKLVPLGQSDGQRILFACASHLPEIAEVIHEDPAAAPPGACTPALAIYSARHEVQYSRLFRS